MIKTRVLHDGLHLSGVACGVYQGFPMVNGEKNPLSRGGCNSPGKGLKMLCCMQLVPVVEQEDSVAQNHLILGLNLLGKSGDVR